MYAHAFLRNFTCKLPRKSSAAVLRSVLISGSIPGRQTNKQHTMATTNGVPLHEVVKKLSEHAPPTLAESWDNVGLLVEPSTPHIVHKLFLTNDLTEDVLDEAIEVSSDFILSYHPPIFRGIKRITQDKWKDRLVVKAIEKRIAIYSPHTAYDVVKGTGFLCLYPLCYFQSIFTLNLFVLRYEFHTLEIIYFHIGILTV